MKKIVILLLMLLCRKMLLAQSYNSSTDYKIWGVTSIGKGSNVATSESAILELGLPGTNKGLLLPRVLDTTSILNPVYGLSVYSISQRSFCYYDGGCWRVGISAGALDGKEDVINKSTSVTLGNSNTLYPSQLAVKTYVDNTVSAGVAGYIPRSEKGVANGVATIDATGKIPLSQISLTTTNVPEGVNQYWTNARGDGRYPQLSGSYLDPSWLSSLSWTKITGRPNTLEGYGIIDAAPATGSKSYIQNQSYGPQFNSRFWVDGGGNMQTLGTSTGTDVAQWKMFNKGGQDVLSSLRFTTSLNNAENGGNEGSDYTISRWNNSGYLLNSPFTINRATGIVTTVDGLRTASGSGTIKSGDYSLIHFYDTDGTTRLGYVGDVNGDACLVSDAGAVSFRAGAGADEKALRINGTGFYFDLNETSAAVKITSLGDIAANGSITSRGTSTIGGIINKGALVTKTRVFSGNGSIIADDYTIFLSSPSGSGGVYTISLPDPALSEGRELEFWAKSALGSWATNYTISRIDGADVTNLTGGEKIKVINGQWHLLYKSTY